MMMKLRFVPIMFAVAAIVLSMPLSAEAQVCQTGLTHCLNDGSKDGIVTQLFEFNDGVDGAVVSWAFYDCQTDKVICGDGTISKKDDCKVTIVAKNDGYDIAAEVNMCLNQGKAKGKGPIFFENIGIDGFQFTDANLGDCPDCSI